MVSKKILLSGLAIFLGLGLIFSIYLFISYRSNHIKSVKLPSNRQVLSATKNPDHTIVLLGDSMTEYLGNSVELQQYLKDYYPNKTFLLLNYGFGSTNITSGLERIERDSTHSGRLFKAIKDIPYDLIIVESFGHNPLSEYSLKEGLKKQTETLDKIVEALSKNHPKSAIVFMATLGPNKDKYAQGVTELKPEQRKKWVVERSAYIQNHIDYARSHGIPLINVYEKSFGQDKTVNLDFINSTDFIHPSPAGVYFISQQIAKFISENNLLPK